MTSASTRVSTDRTRDPAARACEDHRDGGHVMAPVDQSGAGEVGKSGRGPEHRLKLVGGERVQRRYAGEQQSRHHDQPAAAGDGIDEAGQHRDGGEGRVNPWVDHVPRNRSSRAKSRYVSRTSTSLGTNG